MDEPNDLNIHTDPGGIVLIVEDQIETQLLLKNQIEVTFPNLQIVLFDSITKAKDWLNKRKIKLEREPLIMALIDLGLPDGSGCEIIKILAEQEPDTSSIVVTIYDDNLKLFEALSAGASGYLLKDDGPELMATLLRRIQQGEPALSPSIARSLLGHFHAPRAKVQNTEVKLTAREIETLTLISRGFTVAECASQLALSPQTVAGYVKAIYQKLHISNRAEATREAIRRGLA